MMYEYDGMIDANQSLENRVVFSRSKSILLPMRNAQHQQEKITVWLYVPRTIAFIVHTYTDYHTVTDRPTSYLMPLTASRIVI
jgi:hypothetical protein